MYVIQSSRLCVRVLDAVRKNRHHKYHMVGKFQLYRQIYNILVAFLLNKTLSITAISVPLPTKKIVEGKNHCETIELELQASELSGLFKQCIDCASEKCIYESTIGVDAFVHEKKMIALFFNFHYYYFMGNLFFYCTCFCRVNVFLWYRFTICHFVTADEED